MTIENKLLTYDSDDAAALAAALGLPVKNLKSFALTIAGGDVASLTAVYYVNEDNAKGATEILRRYKIVEIKDDPHEMTDIP